MTTWFTGDTHFGHTNIIKYCKRPFDTVEEMDEALIINWNARVGQYEHIYHIGDFSFRGEETAQRTFDRLNGIKHLIIGNHDKYSVNIEGWKWIKHYHELRLNKKTIILFHYAMRTWRSAHKGNWALYGHSHGNLPDDPHALSIDVGVDCHDYAPISFEEIYRIMNRKKPFVPVDHHGRDKKNG